MAKQFCTNCGAEMAESATFCTACGKKPDAAQAGAQPQQNPQQQYVPQQYGQQQYGRQPQKPKKGLILGIAAAAAAVVLIVVLVIVLGGGSANALKDYDYDDILGYYAGSATLKSFDFSGDMSSLAALGATDLSEMEDEFKSLKNKNVDCEVSVYDDSIEIWVDENLFDGTSLSLEDAEFVKGVAKGKYSETQDMGYGVSVVNTTNYKIILQEDNRNDYRLTGTVTFESKITGDVLGAKINAGIKTTVEIDVTYDD